MSDKDILKDLFSEKLGNYEATVNPKLWSAISSQIGTTTATGSVVGISILSKWIIGASIAAAVVTGGILIYSPAIPKTEIKQISDKVNSSIISSPVLKEEVKNIEKEGMKYEVVKEEKTLVIDSKNQDVIIETSQSLTGFTANYNVDPIKNIVVENIVISNQKESYKTIPIEEAKKITNVEVDPFSVSEVPSENIVTKEKILLPNTFTPNMDGVNDEFKISLNDVKDFSIVILDSKNKIVYKSEDPDFIWNGIGLSGEMVEAGNYIYYITAKNSTGKEVLEYSTLTIVR